MPHFALAKAKKTKSFFTETVEGAPCATDPPKWPV